MLLLEGLESLALLCSLFNIQLQFDLGRLRDVFIVRFQFMLTRNLIVKIVTSRHEISGAKDSIFCQFIVKRHGMGIDVVASCCDRCSVGLSDRFFGGCDRSSKAGPLLFPGVV